MGIVRKALFISTAGLSDIVLGEEPRKRTPAKAAQSKAVAQTKAKTMSKATKAAGAGKKKTARRPARTGAKKQTSATTMAAPATTMAAPAARPDGIGDQLAMIAEMRNRGDLSASEFQIAKAKILGISPVSGEPDFSSAAFPAVEANVAAARRLNDMAAGDGMQRPATIDHE